MHFPQTTPPIGILVDGLTMPLVIEDVVLDGFWVGIALRDTCPACLVEVRDARLETTYTGIQAGAPAEPFGPTIPVRGGLLVVRTHFEAMDTPPPTRVTPNDVFGVGVDAGLHGRAQMEGNLTFEDVTMHAAGRNLGPALTWTVTAPGTFTARNLTIIDHETGVGIGAAADLMVRMEQFRMDCGGEAFTMNEPAGRAIHLAGMFSFDGDGIEVTNCSHPVECGRQCGEAIVLGNTGQGYSNATGEVVLRNLTMRHNVPQALSISQRQRVVMEDVLVEDGFIGASEISVVELHMTNVTFRDLAWLGAFAAVERLHVERSMFQHNGGRSQQDGFLAGGGFFVNGDGTPLIVRNSSFVGNEPEGLYSGSELIDASGNWWGSPLGPSVRTRLPGFGDVAGGVIVTAPHLTAPP